MYEATPAVYGLRAGLYSNGPAHSFRIEAGVVESRDAPALPGPIGQSTGLGGNGQPVRRGGVTRRRARQEGPAENAGGRRIEAAPFCAQGQTCDLPFHVGRPAAD